MAENKTLCIACKYKFHDRDLQPCADCLRSTQLAQQGIDRYQRAAQPQQASPASETRKAHPAARTLCFACKYMYCCLLYTSPSPRDRSVSRMPSSA